jgi:hypothetical protein
VIAERPAFRDWIADGVLGHGAIAEQMGERWAGDTRAGFLRGDGPATELALLATGPVALDAALRELPGQA